MASETIFITGVTGHVGFAVLLQTLVKGYKVIAAVRSDAKAGPVKSAKSIQPFLSQLSFVIVPDITISGAFDKVIKGVDYIVHVASPIPDIHDPTKMGDYKTPAVQGTTNILYSALEVPSIKRVVITSSIAAVSPDLAELYNVDITPDSDGVPPPEPHDNGMFAYTASKVLAHKATLSFIAEQKPQFTIVNIMPSYVIGPNELATTVAKVNEGSNCMVLSPLLGEEKPFDMMVAMVSLEDVARIHVESLTSTKIKSHENFLLSYDWESGFQWDDSISIVEKAFPDAVKNGILPLGGHTPETPPVRYDSTKAVETFGPLQSPKEMVEKLVGYYVEVAGRA